MLPSQPYLLRAIYEWIVDNEMTPYVLVNAQNDEVQVPLQYVDNGKIVLNIAPRAVSRLELGNNEIMFSARFSGNPTEVSFPVSSVMAIYAKENGQGMVFNEAENGGGDGPNTAGKKTKKPKLKLVK
ncbi:MAG: ClpXP protease specificity-enhancing factor [Gammaproteobacteria bacterium]|nr:ClpXP protease specificity-enhancing factor [Gammaproteobacteria bacterium]MDH5653610.1 ClpXP protease specificity-enhancing factor [Gammaproteobacteria bacterium]